jgi:formylglycine-generating enzyme required for sulfatase activity
MINTKTMWGLIVIAFTITLIGGLLIFGDWLEVNHAELQPVATAITILAGISTIVGFVFQLRPGKKEPTQEKDSSEPVRSLKDLEQTYYRVLAGECERLELDKVAGFDTGISKVTLPDIYTDQYVLPASKRRNKESGESDFLGDRIGGSVEPMALLNAAAQSENRRVVVLGPVGCGKSSFINVLGWKIAQFQLGVDIQDLPEVFKRRPLARILLRNVARTFKQKASQEAQIKTPLTGAEVLWQDIRRQLQRSLGETEADALYPAFKSKLINKGIFLFDGLDEVPEESGWRFDILDSVEQLLGQLDDRARVIVTSRPYAYARPEQRIAALPVLFMLNMKPELIKAFIGRWYQKIAPVKGWEDPVAGRRGEDLASILEEREYLHPMAGRPLLLTLIASLHSSRGVLPHKRAELYKESLSLLLQRWHQRLVDQEYPMEPEILALLNQPLHALTAALEDLAYRVHKRQGEEARLGKTPADIEDVEAAGMFNRHMENPRMLLDFLDNNSGILVGQGSGYFRFVHRSFQEYLAAGYLSRQIDGIDVTLQDHIAEAPDWWREVFLLAVSRFSKLMVTAKGMLDSLMLRGWTAPPDNRRNVQAPLLAGLGLRELRLPEDKGLYPFMEETINRASQSLVDVIEKGVLPVDDRLDAGDVLGELGDPRPGVCKVFVQNDIEVPEIDWVEIPAGHFTMGSEKTDIEACEYEKPPFSWNVGRFKISRYPVTHRQYACFIQAGGYDDNRYWKRTPSGLIWKNGDNPDLEEFDFGDKSLKCRYTTLLKARIDRSKPRLWDYRRLGIANRPVIGVNWYEALAFCRWLSVQQGEEVSLPTEAQWERAARGPSSFKYPWGNEWCAQCCNSEESGYRQTCAVGLFPEGKSSAGEELIDIAGNVWEWTTTLWGKKISTPDTIYPYEQHQDRENLQAEGFRIIRGGSWGLVQRLVRSMYRFRFLPGYGGNNLGFRVVVSLADSGD